MGTEMLGINEGFERIRISIRDPSSRAAPHAPVTSAAAACNRGRCGTALAVKAAFVVNPRVNANDDLKRDARIWSCFNSIPNYSCGSLIFPSTENVLHSELFIQVAFEFGLEHLFDDERSIEIRIFDSANYRLLCRSVEKPEHASGVIGLVIPPSGWVSGYCGGGKGSASTAATTNVVHVNMFKHDGSILASIALDILPASRIT